MVKTILVVESSKNEYLATTWQIVVVLNFW
jgi:hypothetical protein